VDGTTSNSTSLDETRKLLAAYAASESLGWSARAKHDSRLRTGDLLALALDEVRADRASEHSEPAPALVVLLLRSEEETRQAAHDMLQSADAAQRELGARIMREFGAPEARPRQHAGEFLQALIRAVDVEEDEDALRFQLSAIGWQGLPEAQNLLLRFIGDHRNFIRVVVGDNLRALAALYDQLPGPIGDALLKLARDRDPMVAWSVLYDVADSPADFLAYRDQFIRVATDALGAEDAELRDVARAALTALGDLPR
jgi:hypothetical protein